MTTAIVRGWAIGWLLLGVMMYLGSGASTMAQPGPGVPTPIPPAPFPRPPAEPLPPAPVPGPEPKPIPPAPPRETSGFQLGDPLVTYSLC